MNKRSAEVVADALTSGISPVEYMLSVLRNEEADPKERAWAAEKAAPYLHPRPAPAARTIELALPDTSTAEGLVAGAAVIIHAVATGTLAPTEAQSLMAVIEGQRKAIETAELEKRITKLEAATNAAAN